MSRLFTAVIIVAALLGACGDDDETVAGGTADDTVEDPVVGDQDGGIDSDDGNEEEAESGGASTSTTMATSTTEGTDATGDGEVVETIEIIETSFDLSSPRAEGDSEPLSLSLPRPGTYTFRAVNEAGVVHALQVQGEGVDEATGDIDPGATAELTVTFDEPGEYQLYCPILNHEQLGMDGSVTVEG